MLHSAQRHAPWHAPLVYASGLCVLGRAHFLGMCILLGLGCDHLEDVRPLMLASGCPETCSLRHVLVGLLDCPRLGCVRLLGTFTLLGMGCTRLEGVHSSMHALRDPKACSLACVSVVLLNCPCLGSVRLLRTCVLLSTGVWHSCFSGFFYC